jgi:dTDP-4-dehydrorhamnose reductase
MSKDKNKVLITGAGGQLGQEIVKVFEKDWVVIPTDNHNLDITDEKHVQKVLTKEKPNLIIHCAAWTNVDAAAENSDSAMKVNGEGTKIICEAAKSIGATVVYISTNEVFDGKKKTSYTEEDKPNPINPYAKSKLAGEKYCQEILGSSCIIIRSSWLYGPGSKNNFPNKIINKAREVGSLKVTSDEIATPTYTSDLAKAIKELVEKDIAGVFHLVNSGQASRYEWAKEIINDKKIIVPITPMKLDDYPRASKPPKYSALSTEKAKKLGIALRNWKNACREYLDTYLN